MAPITGANKAPPKNSNNHSKTKKTYALLVNPIGIATIAANIISKLQNFNAFGFSYPPSNTIETVTPPKTTPKVGAVIYTIE